MWSACRWVRNTLLSLLTGSFRLAIVREGAAPEVEDQEVALGVTDFDEDAGRGLAARHPGVAAPEHRHSHLAVLERLFAGDEHLGVLPSRRAHDRSQGDRLRSARKCRHREGHGPGTDRFHILTISVLHETSTSSRCFVDNRSYGQACQKTYCLAVAPTKGSTDALGSMTVYASDLNLMPDPIDRYSNGDRVQGLENADGGTTIHIQNELPGADTEPNRLPAGSGAWFSILHLDPRQLRYMSLFFKRNPTNAFQKASPSFCRRTPRARPGCPRTTRPSWIRP